MLSGRMESKEYADFDDSATRHCLWGLPNRSGRPNLLNQRSALLQSCDDKSVNRKKLPF